uniref:Innexin n=1 Tax=Steinernema glaseri TaxID=37863 RepID=A0A1I8ASQ2_9BILA
MSFTAPVTDNASIDAASPVDYDIQFAFVFAVSERIWKFWLKVWRAGTGILDTVDWLHAVLMTVILMSAAAFFACPFLSIDTIACGSKGSRYSITMERELQYVEAACINEPMYFVPLNEILARPDQRGHYIKAAYYQVHITSPKKNMTLISCSSRPLYCSTKIVMEYTARHVPLHTIPPNSQTTIVNRLMSGIHLGNRARWACASIGSLHFTLAQSPALVYLIMKLLFIVNTAIQFYTMAVLFGQGNLLWGWRMAVNRHAGLSWRYDGLFPTVIQCDYQIMVPMPRHLIAAGMKPADWESMEVSSVRHFLTGPAIPTWDPRTVQCLLPYNVYAAPLFLFVYFATALLFVITVFNLLWWIARLQRRSRKAAIGQHLDDVRQTEAVPAFVRFLGRDGAMLLYLMRHNTHVDFLPTILTQMCDYFAALSDDTFAHKRTVPIKLRLEFRNQMEKDRVLRALARLPASTPLLRTPLRAKVLSDAPQLSSSMRLDFLRRPSWGWSLCCPRTKPAAQRPFRPVLKQLIVRGKARFPLRAFKNPGSVHRRRVRPALSKLTARKRFRSALRTLQAVFKRMLFSEILLEDSHVAYRRRRTPTTEAPPAAAVQQWLAPQDRCALRKRQFTTTLSTINEFEMSFV